MSDQFISVITDEAMTRICYDGGWNLTPWKFFISETDVLEGWSDSQIFNTDGTVTDEAFQYLKEYTTEQMQNDYTAGNVWYNNKFSSISKATENTLTHHINIPGDVAIDTSSKSIKTIFFLYQDIAGQEFLYALARNNTTLIFETGVTQSFFFNFTVSNSATQDLTEFILNYSCSHEIQDHNTTVGDDIHSFLLARDGSRTATGILEYSQNFSFTKDTQLVTKKYTDDKVQALDTKLSYQMESIIIPGTIQAYAGSSIPSGWLLCNGQAVSRTTYKNLYNAIGTKYGTGDGSSTFNVPYLLNRFIEGSTYAGTYYQCGLPNITGSFSGNDLCDDLTSPSTSGAFYAFKDKNHRDANNGSWGAYGFNFDASRSNSIYGRSSVVQPEALTMLYIIKY